MSTESKLRYQVMTIDHLSADERPSNLDGGRDGTYDWQPSRDYLSANDLRNGYVMTLCAGASPAIGATVRPVPGPPVSEPFTAYRVTVTSESGQVTTDETVYLR